MKRRNLIGYAGAGLVTALITNFGSHEDANAQSSSLFVKWLGHTCFLFSDRKVKVLVNPFRPIGCTANYSPPKVETDVVLISSQLLDEGDVTGLPGNPKLVYQEGVYNYGGIQFQGIPMDHDLKGGKQFGKNIAWKWQQGGINILHLGGAAAPITFEQKIPVGSPDLLLIPVGGGAKAYNAQAAKDAIAILKPKLIIPTQYRTEASDPNNCDISPVDEFLASMKGTHVIKSKSDFIVLSPNKLPESTEIQVLSYNFNSKNTPKKLS